MDRADAESICAAENIELTDLYNRIALIVAERFDNGTLPYEDGDAIMNAIFSMMVDGEKPMDAIEPAWSIYLAFDEGEYYHGGSTDPVESFTRPQILISWTMPNKSGMKDEVKHKGLPARRVE